MTDSFDAASSVVDDGLLERRVFLEGPVGCGKTTYATRHLLRLLELGAQPDRILVLVPQVTLARPFQLALHESPFSGGAVNILTAAGLARKAVETWWPLIAERMGFGNPAREPTFLNVETAQYFMARFASPMVEARLFDGVAISPQRIVSQALDNLNRAAIMRFGLDEVADRLVTAWGARQSARLPAFKNIMALGAQFRQHCLENNLLDYSLTLEAFASQLMPDPAFVRYLHEQLDFLIADNVEEDTPTTHDLIGWLAPALRGALLIYDSDGGYRTFLGADADQAYALSALCDERRVMSTSVVTTPGVAALGKAFNRLIGPVYEPPSPDEPQPTASAREGFTFAFHRFYPQMIDWVCDQILELIRQGVPPDQIAVVAPYLNDSLRFSLSYQIEARSRAQGINVETLTHRPSRALRDEAVTRALLTLATLAHPEWVDGVVVVRPPVEDVAEMLTQVIADLDPVRARLLADIVYRRNERSTENAMLSTFARINPEMQKRVSYLAGQRYEGLREWLDDYRAQAEHVGHVPLDHFLRRLFGEILSQPGYGFHADLEAGRIAAQLIESAQRFRVALYPGDEQDWIAAGREYINLISQRLLPALFAQSWQDEDTNMVFLAPVSTFLLRNRFVDYLFWLDVGNESWSRRLDQPLTHPYVLRREYPADQEWTDDLETETQQDALYRTLVGLVRRCRKQIYVAIADLSESGYEQRGGLLHVLQHVLRADSPDADGTGTTESTSSLGVDGLTNESGDSR